jgi:hypothetical protein
MLGLVRLPLPAANPRAGPALLSFDGCNIIFWSLAVTKDVVVANTSLRCDYGSRVSGSGRRGMGLGSCNFMRVLPAGACSPPPLEGLVASGSLSYRACSVAMEWYMSEEARCTQERRDWGTTRISSATDSSLSSRALPWFSHACSKLSADVDPVSMRLSNVLTMWSIKMRRSWLSGKDMSNGLDVLKSIIETSITVKCTNPASKHQLQSSVHIFIIITSITVKCA